VFVLKENTNPKEIHDGSNTFELVEAAGDARIIVLAFGPPGSGKSTVLREMAHDFKTYHNCNPVFCDLDDRQTKFRTIFVCLSRYFRFIKPKKIVSPSGSDKAMQVTWVWILDQLTKDSNDPIFICDAGPNYWMRFQLVTTARVVAYLSSKIVHKHGLDVPELRFHIHQLEVAASGCVAFFRNYFKRERVVHPKPFWNAMRGVKNSFRQLLPLCDSWGTVKNGISTKRKDI
jgi:hypothetical protein